MKRSNLLTTVYLLFGLNILGQHTNTPSGAFIPESIVNLDNYYQQIHDNAGGNLEMTKGSGYIQYQRNRNFYEQRRQFDGTTNLDKRWEIFELLKSDPSRASGPIANWQNLGPNEMDGHGGRMISHAFDPLVPNIIWSGSASGGVWKSMDGGTSWEAKSDNIPSTGVGAVAINPQNSDMVLIGTGEGYRSPAVFTKGGIGVFRSTDGGTTWLPTDFSYPPSAGVSVLKLNWHPTNPNVIWMAATNGLWKSNDMGLTWTMIIGDGTNHQNFIFNDIIIQQTNPDIMFVSQENVGVMKSTDAGTNFSLLNNGIPATDINFISIDQCVTQPNVLYASIARLSTFGLHGVYKSTNNGSTWTQINTPANDPFCNAGPNGTFCQGWYNNTIGVSPTDPDLIFLGGITFWRSDDSGSNWEQKDRTICANCINTPSCATYVDHHDIGFDPYNPGTIYSFNDGGVSKSADNGNCWSNVNNGLVTAQFLGIASGRSNPDIIIGGLWDHGLQGADIGNGLNWERWGFWDGVDVFVDSENPNRLFGTWINGTYWRSLNGLSSIASQITNGINLNENTSNHFAPLRMDPQNPDVLLGSTQLGVYRSANAGTNWQKVHSANVPTDVAFSQADPNYCYAASWNGASWFFHRSEDNGLNWAVTLNSPGWRVTDIKTSGLEPLTVFASRNSINPNTPHIYKSTNGGENWISIQGDLPDIQVNAIAVDHELDDVIYAATDLGVFITINGGVNWTEFNDDLPVTFVNDIEFNPVDRKIRIATFGRGVWISDAYNDFLHISEGNFSLDDIILYPNPSSDRFFIRLNNYDQTITNIDILNYLGQQILSIDPQKISGGINTFEIELTNNNILQSAGMYLVRVQTDKRSFVKKLLLSR